MTKFEAHRRISLPIGGDAAFYIQDRKFILHDWTGPHKLRIKHEGPGMDQILVVTDQNWTDLPGGLKIMSDPGAAPGTVELLAQGLDAFPILDEAQQAAKQRNTAAPYDPSQDGPR